MSVITSLDELRVRLPELAAEARSRGAEFESARRIAPDFAHKLKQAGVARLLVPQAYGGLGCSLPDWLEVMMQLAEADASTAWVSAHAGICSGLICASADARFREELFADPMSCVSWSNLPRVKVEEHSDGLQISGNWAFESGCTMASHVGGMVLLPSLREGGLPRQVVALVPVAQATIVETWDPVGLGGTGSHDVRLDDVFVPRYRTFGWPAAAPAPDAASPASVFVPGIWLISSCAAATHLGLARRALDEARNEMRGKVERYSQQPLLQHPSTQRSLEAAEGLWWACRAGLREALRSVWDSALLGKPLSAEQRVNARVAAVTAVHRSAEVVRMAYDAAGASAVRRSGVLERLLREASCLTHHISVNLASYEQTGPVRSGVNELSLLV
jgi:alkylation response protein AidB-like acyl-CoA dehydrogenase